MDETEREELKEAYRKEKDPRVVARMLAVHMVYVRKAGIDETAAHLMRSARWVRNWLHRYDEGGLDGLRDLPRSGRPRRIPRETIEQIVNKTVQLNCTPAGLQKRIHEETGIKTAYHILQEDHVHVRPVTSRSRREFTSTGQAKRPSRTGNIASKSKFHA